MNSINSSMAARGAMEAGGAWGPFSRWRLRVKVLIIVETYDESFENENLPRPWPRWLKRIGWVLLMLTILAAGRAIWNHGQKASKLQETLAEMDRVEPGWRLEEIEAAREEIPEEENSAPVVLAAARLMPPQWLPSDFFEHLRLVAPSEKLTDEDFDRLTKELAKARPALDMAGKLADMPRGRYHIHHDRNPIATLLPHLQQSRELVSLLVYEAMRQNQKGETKKALTSCRAALNAARSPGDEPIIISQLVRNAGVTLACQAIERTLAQGEPPPEDMAALQKLLENEDAFPSLLLATRGERAMLHKVFEVVENGIVSMDELAQARSGWLESTFVSMWRMDTRQDNALFLSLMTRRIAEVQLPMHEQAAAEKRFEQDARELPKTAVITRLLMPVPKMGEAFRRKHAYLRCTIAALAAERYRREKGMWPEKIDKLCPKYLVNVPLDPFDGEPLRYRRLEDGLVIYAVGNDEIDNDGNLDREHPNQPGVDIGYRLWDVAKRRQPARPKPPEVNPER
jgi:hypothetical protein